MNIFIAGLSYNLSEAELEELFAEYGEVVSAKVIMDRETGRSKGYGFVEMAEDEAGNKAIEALNGAEVDGKTLSVSVARPKTEGPRRSYNNNGGGGYHGGNRGGGYGNRDNNYGGGNRDNNLRWRKKQILICRFLTPYIKRAEILFSIFARFVFIFSTSYQAFPPKG